MNIDLAKSYLQARDPSIISYNRTNLGNVKAVLADLMSSASTESEAEEKIEENKFINVYLRIRRDIDISNIYKIEGNNFTCKVPEGSYALRNVKCGDTMKRTYTFTNIFGPEYDQKTIFDCIVKPKLVSFINGSNSTLFTYGASGSGKTYTIVGTPEEPGLIPRALEYVFKSLPKVSIEPEIKPLPNGTTQNITKDMMVENEKYKNWIVNSIDQSSHVNTYTQMQNRLSTEPIAEVSVDTDVSVSAWISFAEIYNEIVYDLLSIPNSKNKIRQRLALGKSKDERTYIKKLTYLHVTEGLEAYQILQYGLYNLNYASTAVNSHSSRSHCIFTIRLVQSSKSSSDVYISDFNFCDLAGAERLKKTMNFGDRLKESNNINTSLLVLGRCMDSIKKCQQAKDKRLIPFRESKLTQIFQKALMGYENVEMIVNVNLSRDMFDETIHVLNFSALASTIIVEEELSKPIKRENRFSLMMQKEETPTENKVTIIEHRNYGYLKKKLIESQNEITKLKREINRLNSEIKQNLIDPNEEIERLHKAIETIIDERDNIMVTCEKRIIEERESLNAIYKEYMERYAKIYKENEEHVIRRLREEYEEKIAEMQTITISSDDEESPETSHNNRLKRELEQSENLRKLQKEKLEYTESLLEDAKEEYRSSQKEIKRVSQENNQLKSEVVKLKEEIESLKLQLMHQSMNFLDDESSGPEDSESQHKVESSY
ncbi:kinesin-like protein subito [Diorhabda sublineata]|uniref:kinesin-like protein subito n=1 Tax=Diorhabda sublineata TaxID=1163346 RepID=UPI0024E090A4|nr:kinesin-like protein subito [Diorhabda sublineata]